MSADICPLCKGEGKKVIIVQHAQTKRPYTVIDWCICMKSRLVSGASNTSLLLGLGDTYMAMDKVDPSLKFDPTELAKCPSYLISSETSYDTFCLNVKAVVMNHVFRHPAPSIYACDAMDILKRFYVEQDDHSNVSLSDTDKYDLFIFTIGTDEKNLQLKTCVAQVVQNRKNLKKPTWIYVKKPTLDLCIQEYSADLVKYLDSYKRIDLENRDEKIKPRHSQSKKSAEKGIF